jgi:F-type H+-transporting ATPase subunit delta
MSDIARGYAQALFQVARAEGVLEQVEDELFRFARLLEQEPKLREALTDINFPPEHRAKMVHELLGPKASPHTTNIISFLVQQGRARELAKIIDSLVELAAEEQRRAVAEVRTAAPLDDQQRVTLAEAIARATGKQVDLKVIVDPTVIGGLLVRVGDQVFDGTVRRRLELAKQHIGRADNG